jgi:hypothetical protein
VVVNNSTNFTKRYNHYSSQTVEHTKTMTYERIRASFFYCLFISVLSLEIQLLEKEGWGPINHWNLCLCLSQANDIRHSLLVFNGLRWEVVVPFGKIGRIVDHHCLDFITLRASAEFWHNGYETKYEVMKITEDMITKNHILCKLW